MTPPDDDILALDARHIWHPFTQAGTAPPPIQAVAASGLTITAADGRQFLDMAASWWTNLHGHAHPAIARAVAEQAATLEQVIFADFTHAPAVRLASRICRLLPGDLDRAFYSDDGSTAVEVALKLAHQFWRNRGEERGTYIAFQGGYHGDTVGAMSAGQSCGIFEQWRSMLFPVQLVPFPATWDHDPDVDTKEAAALDVLDRLLAENRGTVSAVILEPLIQGAAGMRVCRPGFLKSVTERVTAAGTLLILDEVMTGFGRTGAPFACLKAGITPDMICLSKGLTGGFLPMGLTVTREVIFQEFLGQDLTRAFLHGHSYTANPLGCAAGLASLDLLETPDCQARIAAMEALHRVRLDSLSALPHVRRTRLCGTMAAFQVDGGGSGYGSATGPRLKAALLERGILLRPLGDVLYLLPPYCATEAELTQAWDTLEEVLRGL